MSNKSLGQHWLKDRLILEAIADSVTITPQTTVLEIGPGLGTLTSVLLTRAGRVVAVEYDHALATKLPGQFPGKNLEVVDQDILEFNLEQLPSGYVVVANLPYYITSKIIKYLVGGTNRPAEMALLVQQEVAEKLSAGPGQMTALAVKAQFDYDIQKTTRVPKTYFTPQPKVDSQVIVFKKRNVGKYAQSDNNILSKVINAGFSAPRKNLRSSLSGGLGISKNESEKLLIDAMVSPQKRAQDLSLDDWLKLAEFVRVNL